MDWMELEALPPKQRDVLQHIQCFIQQHGYPPSIQQLCKLCGVTSTSTIHYHISALKKKGFIDWDPTAKRSITLCGDSGEPETQKGQLPMLGSIAAGSPLQTMADTTEVFDLSEDICPSGCYALKVRGVSMIEDHIMDGDIVVINPRSSVRDGDVVVALVDGETATLKRIFREKGRIRLQPANAEMDPIYVHEEQVQVQGKVEAVVRRMHP